MTVLEVNILQIMLRQQLLTASTGNEGESSSDADCVSIILFYSRFEYFTDNHSVSL